MAADYLMNIASVMFFICYVPELYANWKNKNANVWNLPEKVVMLVGSGFAFAYAVTLEDTALITNYGPILALDVVAFGMRAWYAWKNRVAAAGPYKNLEPPAAAATPSSDHHIIVVRPQEGSS